MVGSVKAPFIYIVQRTSRSHRGGGRALLHRGRPLAPYATNYFHFGNGDNGGCSDV